MGLFMVIGLKKRGGGRARSHKRSIRRKRFIFMTTLSFCQVGKGITTISLSSISAHLRIAIFSEKERRPSPFCLRYFNCCPCEMKNEKGSKTHARLFKNGFDIWGTTAFKSVSTTAMQTVNRQLIIIIKGIIRPCKLHRGFLVVRSVIIAAFCTNHSPF